MNIELVKKRVLEYYENAKADPDSATECLAALHLLINHDEDIVEATEESIQIKTGYIPIREVNIRCYYCEKIIKFSNQGIWYCNGMEDEVFVHDACANKELGE